jgi:hypothetical protein
MSVRDMMLRAVGCVFCLVSTPVWAAVVPEMGAVAPAAASSAVVRRLPIGAARKLPVGTLVSVEGSVTVPSGLFASSFGDAGFAIQDASGGIYVSTVENLGLTLQQRVSVIGMIADSGGLIEVVPAAAGDVTVEGRGFHVRPQWERTGRVGAANQGLLINVVGVVTQPIEPDPPYGSKIFVNDGSGELRVYVNASTDIDLDGIAQGDLLSVTGFSGAYETPELDVRFQSDLRQPGGK